MHTSVQPRPQPRASDGARGAAAYVSAAAGCLLAAGGGARVRQTYDALAALARRIAAGDARDAAAALLEARRVFAASCPVARWREGDDIPPPIVVAALARAEAWVADPGSGEVAT